MNAPFYNSPERRQAFSRAAAVWIGTPFRYASAVPGAGGGVDCVGLQAALHIGCGACDPFTIERRLPLSWHLHHADSGILEFLRAPEVRERLRQIDRDDQPQHGDLVAVKTQLCVHHLCGWLDDNLGKHLLHVPVNGTVQRWSITHPAIRGRIVGIWRIMEAKN